VLEVTGNIRDALDHYRRAMQLRPDLRAPRDSYYRLRGSLTTPQIDH
jgi:hypothetical protein